MSTTVPAWLPQRVNTGPWLSHYTVDELETRLAQERVILPICSVRSSSDELEELGQFLLPPLYVWIARPGDVLPPVEPEFGD